MEPANFDESNVLLAPPPGRTEDEVTTTNGHLGHDFEGRPVMVTCWKPTRAELDEIERTGRVWVISRGTGVPSQRLTGYTPFACEGASRSEPAGESGTPPAASSPLAMGWQSIELAPRIGIPLWLRRRGTRGVLGLPRLCEWDPDHEAKASGLTPEPGWRICGNVEAGPRYFHGATEFAYPRPPGENGGMRNSCGSQNR